ncbi:MAG: hypothetical protein ACFFBI_08615 [Promethearchaeota archaeon]
MEKENKDKLLKLINEVENKNSEIENHISNLRILSRNETLEEILNDILKKNTVLQEIEKSKGEHSHLIVKDQINTLKTLVENSISKINENPTKKIIYLREFLDNFQSISSNDKDVILNSLKDEKDKDKLREKMSSLVDIFL